MVTKDPTDELVKSLIYPKSDMDNEKEPLFIAINSNDHIILKKGTHEITIFPWEISHLKLAIDNTEKKI